MKVITKINTMKENKFKEHEEKLPSLSGERRCQPIIDIPKNNQCGNEIGGIGKVYVVLDKEYLEIKKLLQDIIKWEEVNFIEADLLERIKCIEYRMKL